MAKHPVSFIAHEKVKEPVKVTFREQNGKVVSFPAHKVIKEPVKVTFMANSKKK